MTDTEEKDLRSLGEDLAAALQSQWQPACIARAFATPRAAAVALTMQAWIDLDAAYSPLLRGDVPQTAAELATAFDAFDLSYEELSPAETVDVVEAMHNAVCDAFAAALKTVPPQEGDRTSDDDGFGDWLPLLACLVQECAQPLPVALAMRVDRVFMLVAAVRRNQGWRVAGTPYALREVLKPEEGGDDA